MVEFRFNSERASLRREYNSPGYGGYIYIGFRVCRLGGRRLLIERCDCSGPGNYAWRSALTPEQRAAGASSSGMARRNPLSFFTPCVRSYGNVEGVSCEGVKGVKPVVEKATEPFVAHQI